jgi:hypothetical protein
MTHHGVRVVSVHLIDRSHTGCRSEAEVRTVFGEERKTFVEAAMALGIMDDDKEYYDCLTAASKLCPRVMRDLLLIILIHCQPKLPTALITTFLDELVADWLGTPQQKLILLLQFISNNTDITLDDLGVDFPAVPIIHRTGSSAFLETFVSNPADIHLGCLNAEQQLAHDAILADMEIDARHVRSGTHVFAVMAAAGTGKTFLINAILQTASQRRLRVVPSATSALAASLLGHARTSKFVCCRCVTCDTCDAYCM